MDICKYFNDRADQAGTCCREEIAKVRRVQVGDKIFVNNFGLPIQTQAEENGYHVEVNDVYAFVSEENFVEFQKEFTRTTAEELGLEKIDLPEGADFKPVRKGERVVVQPFSDTDMFIEDHVSQDGYLFTLDGKKRFMSDIEFRSTFNVQAAALDESQQLYVCNFGTIDNPLRYIVLDEDVTLPFIEGDYDAQKGEVLIENEQDVDGFTVFPAKSFESDFTVVKAAPALKR